MHVLLTPALAGLLSLSMALYLAPIIIRAALRYGIVDKPKPPLKLHGEPVPYLGGMVIFVAFLVSLAVLFPFDERVLAILLSSSLIVSVGLIDDLGTLTPKDKFLGQLIAAIVLVKAGVSVDLAAFPKGADYVVSVVWLVTCMNAFNILDVSDGLAATAGAVGALGATAVALMNDEPMIATMAAALAGACVGFLRVNKEPARMYLGDTGSLLLGAVLGALAMIGRYSDKNAVSGWFVPLTLLSIPLFDLVLVIVARLRAGRPIYFGSPDHFAVRLRHHGWRARSIALVAGAFGALFVAAGIGSTFLPNDAALGVLAGVVALGLGLLLLVLVRAPPRQPALHEASTVPTALPGAEHAS